MNTAKTVKKMTLACAMAAILGFSTVTQAEPITLKLSHVVAENTAKGQMAIKFKELVAERLADKVVVEVYPNAQLFNDDAVLEAMLLGDIQLAAPALSKFRKYTPKIQLFDLPFLFNDLAAVESFQNSENGQSLLTSMQKRGLIGLGYLHNGMKQVSANRPLRSPKDVEGLKIRIMPSDVIAEQYKVLGALPVKKPFSEVFTLLQTKALDGQENTWSNIYSKKMFEVQSDITETNHGIIDYMVVTSDKFWNGLDAETRTELKKALDEAIAYGNQIAAEKEKSDRQAIIDSGKAKVIGLTDAERQVWVDAMKPVWQKYEKEIGAELIQAAAQSK